MATDDRSESPRVVSGGIPADLMVTVRELADAVDRHPTTIRRHCRQGIIAGAELIGRDWTIPYAGAQQYASEYVPYQARRGKKTR